MLDTSMIGHLLSKFRVRNTYSYDWCPKCGQKQYLVIKKTPNQIGWEPLKVPKLTF